MDMHANAPRRTEPTTDPAGRLVLLLAQGLGTGRSPLAPGTLGTLPGVAIFLMLPPLDLGWYLLVLAAVFAVGIPLCGRAATLLRQPDPPSVVWDEVLGFLVTMTGTPASPWNLALGFALFRFFDIVKPWPIGAIDRRVGGGLGIMLDDLVAGLMAAGVLRLLT